MPEPVTMVCLACAGTLFAGISAAGTSLHGADYIKGKLKRVFGDRGHKVSIVDLTYIRDLTSFACSIVAPTVTQAPP